MADTAMQELGSSAGYGLPRSKALGNGNNDEAADDVEYSTTPPGDGNNKEPKHNDGGEECVIVYLKGWKLHTLTIASETPRMPSMIGILTFDSLCLSLFLSTIETTIVSTSLVAITNVLDGFQKSSWIVTSYLLTYTGGAISQLEIRLLTYLQAS